MSCPVGALFISNCRRVSFYVCSAALRGEEKNNREGERGGSYEAEKRRRRVGIVCVPTRFLFRVGFKRLSTSCKHFFRVSFRSNDLPRRVLDVSLFLLLSLEFLKGREWARKLHKSSITLSSSLGPEHRSSAPPIAFTILHLSKPKSEENLCGAHAAIIVSSTFRKNDGKKKEEMILQICQDLCSMREHR